MLATVRGTVMFTGLNDMVIETNGIGLQLAVPRDLAASVRLGTEAFLHTVLIPREDEWLLFGFATVEDKQLFTILRGVTGVGPRTALAILSTLSSSEIAEAVDAGDDSRFRVVPGIGQKTASLIIVSLTGKMPKASNGEATELAEALTGLGWSQSAARDVARDVIREAPAAGLSERLKIALASLGGNS